MDFINMFLIAGSMAMDASAVSLGVGASSLCTERRSRFRLAFHFGVFQAFMPVIGWLAGSTISGLIGGVDHWIAFALLAFIGGRMVREGLSHEDEAIPCDPSRGKTLVMLSVATSIDALAIGISLAMLEVSIVSPAIVIGLVTFGMSIAALYLGRRLGAKFGQRMEIIGGLVLIGIGLRILISHLTV